MPELANPYLKCVKCYQQVTYRRGLKNLPCGHWADFLSACPSWSPVDGCSCRETLGRVLHD